MSSPMPLHNALPPDKFFCAICFDAVSKSELAPAEWDENGNPTVWWDVCKVCEAKEGLH